MVEVALERETPQHWPRNAATPLSIADGSSNSEQAKPNVPEAPAPVIYE